MVIVRRQRHDCRLYHGCDSRNRQKPSLGEAYVRILVCTSYIFLQRSIIIVTTHSRSHDHSHSHSHDHPDVNPHTDLDALGEGSDAAIHAGALRTEKIAKFLEAHFGEVELVETREVEVGEDHGGDSTMEDGEQTPDATNGNKNGTLLVYEPAIVVRLDEYEARIGLVDLVRPIFIWILTVLRANDCLSGRAKRLPAIKATRRSCPGDGDDHG